MEEEIQTPLDGTENGEDDQEQSEEIDTPSIDYEKKFAESTRQEQIRRQQLKSAEEKLGMLVKVEMPTDEEMQNEVENWDYLSDETKALYKRNVVTDRKLNKAMVMIDDITREKRMASEIEQIKTDYPELEGREADFKKFISKPQYKNASLELLVPAYLHQAGSKKIIKNKVEGLDSGRKSRVDTAPGGKRSTMSPGASQLLQAAGLSAEDIRKYSK